MRSPGQFQGKVLPGPVLIVPAPAPVPAGGHVVDNAHVGDPDFVAVLPVAEGELGAGKGSGHGKQKPGLKLRLYII